MLGSGFLLADFINTLTLGQWSLLALVPPAILALYFLKLKRKPLAVPSTYLWSKTIEDLHVNSLWQRLRQNLLLFLQLLLVALLAFALLRPGWRGTELLGQRFIFLIDTSASMSSTDVSPNRLAEAKRQALALIDQMKSGDAAMIISFSTAAKVEQPYTDNRSLLRSRIDLIEQTNNPSDMSEALRAASGLANPGRTGIPGEDVNAAEALAATMYIFSDGGFASIPSFKLGNLDPQFMQIGSESISNVGIVAFSAERNPNKQGELQVFGRVENFGNEAVTVDANLYFDDELLDAQQLEIPGREGPNKPAGSQGIKFDLKDIEGGVMKLTLNFKDQLAADNEASVIVNESRQAKVLLVTPGNNKPLEFALDTEEVKRFAQIQIASPSTLTTSDYQQNAQLGIWDLIIYDQCAPANMPECSTLFIGTRPPESAGWKENKTGIKNDLLFVTDVDGAHPLSQLLTVTDLLIYTATPLEGPQGATVLIDSSQGPLYMVAPRQGFQDAVLGFEIVRTVDGQTEYNTDWFRDRSFPVFAFNAVRYLSGLQETSSLGSTKPGFQRILQASIPVPNILVETPTGAKVQVPREGENKYIFGQTDQLGVYKIREGGDSVTQSFAVNLFDARESDLTPRKTLEIGHEEVVAQQGRKAARQETWRWIVLGALILSMAEWYIYNRRVYF